MSGLSLPPAPRPLAPSQTWRLGELTISCGAQAPEQPASDAADLLIPVNQPLIVQQENLQHILRPPLGLYYWPSCATPLACSSYEGWRLSVPLAALERRGIELCQQQLRPARWRPRLRQALALSPRPGAEGDLAGLLLQLLPLCRNPGLSHGRLLDPLGLDRAIEGLLVVLLCGDLLRDDPDGEQAAQGSRHRIFTDLLVWIEAHLSQPLQLRDLVAESGYSERSLRNFFQERFGCGPVQ